MDDLLSQLMSAMNYLDERISFDEVTFSILISTCIFLHFSIGRIKKNLEEKEMPSTLVIVFSLRILYSLVLFLSLLLLLNFFSVPLTPFLGVLVAVLVAIAVSLRNSLDNIASGVVIIMTRPFNVGDYIETPTIELSKVEGICLFYTGLLTKSGISLRVPNGKLWTTVLKNITQSSDVCIELTVPLNFNGNDISKACQELSQALLQEKNILETPAPLASIWNLRSNGVDIIVRAWVKNSHFYRMRLDLPEIVKNHLEKAKVYNVTN